LLADAKSRVYNLIDQYSSMLDILEGYAFGRDCYIRSQACVPLSEMAVRRRQKLPNGNRFMPGDIAERIKTIGLQMLREAGTNPALLDDVSNILGRIADLTEAQAIETIDRLSAAGDLNGVHNRCGLLIYFALFRETATDLPRFDTAKFKDRLHQELRNGEPRFRDSLIWQMSGGADNEPYPFNTIRPYLTSFISGEYGDAAFLHLRRICEAHVKEHRDEICPIIVRALVKVSEYIAAEPKSRSWNAYDLDQFFDLLVENCDAKCILDGVELMAIYKRRIPQISGRKLAAILEKDDSVRAQELRERHRDALDQ
jgi:hypothetical protein